MCTDEARERAGDAHEVIGCCCGADACGWCGLHDEEVMLCWKRCCQSVGSFWDVDACHVAMVSVSRFSQS